MPKTKLQEYVSRLKNPEPEVPKPNYLRELFKRYMKTQNISSEKLGEILDCSGANVRYILNKPINDWKISELIKIGKIIRCPQEEIVNAIVMSL